MHRPKLIIEGCISYDLEGNINNLSMVFNNVLIESLNYTYNRTDQLQRVTDATANNTGLQSGTTATLMKARQPTGKCKHD